MHHPKADHKQLTTLTVLQLELRQRKMQILRAVRLIFMVALLVLLIAAMVPVSCIPSRPVLDPCSEAHPLALWQHVMQY